MADCGLVGIFSKCGENVYGKLVHSLHILQHRGEDACGILLYNGEFSLKRGLGLVSTNFHFDNIILGDRGIGHTRYPTTNLSSGSLLDDVQPIEISYPWISFYIAHNGTITSFCDVPISQTEMKENISDTYKKYELGEEINTETASQLIQAIKQEMKGGTDTETIGRIIAHLAERIISLNPLMPISEVIMEAFKLIAPRITGSYAFLIQTSDAIIGIRDTYGIRPLCFIDFPDAYALSSESCVMNELRKVCYHSIRIPRSDISPGTAIIISENGVRNFKIADSDRTAFCIFEYAYFSRPDTNFHGKILSSFRQRCGERLGMRLKNDFTIKEAEDSIIIPIPDGGIPFGVGLSRSTGMPLMSHGLIRDKYTGRTFIRGPETHGLDRAALVTRKLSFLHDVVEDKIVILADDSIVRGTTTRRVTEMAIDAGARDVIWCFNFPPIRYICPLGIEMFKGGREQFIANKVDSAESHQQIENGIAKILGSKAVYYMTLEDYISELELTDDQVCTGCVNGSYPYDKLNHMYGKAHD